MSGDGENGYRQLVDRTYNLNGRYVRVCSVHFVSGKPSQLYDSTHLDWVPFKNQGYVKKTVTIAGKVERYSRAVERNAKLRRIDITDSEKGLVDEIEGGDEAEIGMLLKQTLL